MLGILTVLSQNLYSIGTALSVIEYPKQSSNREQHLNTNSTAATELIIMRANVYCWQAPTDPVSMNRSPPQPKLQRSWERQE